MRIFLVGYMYSGKTTVGKQLAKKLNISFVDLDRAIEQRYHVSIPGFFNKYGEDAFRILERNVLEIVSDMDDVVISTGSGTPCFGDNMDFILSKGCVVYLKMTSAAILSRESRSKKQGLYWLLLLMMKKLRKLNRNLKKDLGTMKGLIFVSRL